MKPPVGLLDSHARPVKLAGGHIAVIRPIRSDDAIRLTKALQKLSPESRRRRFLFSRGGYSPEELDYFTHCDGIHHLALVLVETGADGREGQFVAVGRSIQDADDTSLAEVAIAVADDWQHHGVGVILIKVLARRAWAAGIRSWNALLFSDNVAMQKLLDLVGRKQSAQSEGEGVTKLVYHLSPPSDARVDCQELIGDLPPPKAIR